MSGRIESGLLALERQTELKKENTKKETVPDEIDEMLPHYDFSGGVRGKYADRVRRATNLVLLDPDVQEIFPNSDAVNRALRAVVDLMETAKPKKKRSA